jgi:hypothetical protein
MGESGYTKSRGVVGTIVILTVVDEIPASFEALITWSVEAWIVDDPVMEPESSNENPSGRGGCDVHCMG